MFKNHTYVKGKNLVNEEIAEILSFKELSLLFLKYSFNYKNIIGAIILIAIIFVGCIAEVPYYFAFGATLNFSLFLISAMIYGSTFYPFRKSTIFENTQKTNLGKKQIYLAIFISVFLFTGLMYLLLVLLFSFLILINSSLLMYDWFFSTIGLGAGGIFLCGLNFQLVFYWYIAFIFLNFGLFYLFQNISNTKRTFYLFVFFYLILLLIYGNTINVPEVRINYDEMFINHNELKELLNSKGLSDYEIKSILWHFNIPGNLEVIQNPKTKYQNGHYISAFFSILIPHSWINNFCAAIWKGTIFRIRVIDYTHNGINYKYPLSYNNNFLKGANIWKIKEQLWWALSMYIWILYFVFLYLIGSTFSTIKKRNI